ncbi:MAG: PAS domain S-box protein [Deltaproteobacteria bacterium]|jgi:PAS domain S-box-containing protein|nr:PAS domain S-box protein [Deltaproteobacteria bacterium]
MKEIKGLRLRIKELESLLAQAERRSYILTNLLKEATTEFKQALEQVTTSEANFRAIIENAPEAIYIADAETRQILDCNPYTTQWLGYTRSKLLSMRIEDILDIGSRGVRENIRKAVEYGFVHVQERRFRKKSGAFVDAEMTGTVVEIQGRKCFLALVRDITERKTIEELSRYKELFDHAIDPIIISHSQGAFLEINAVACKRLGYSRRRLLNMSFKNVVSPDQMDILREMGQKIRSGETVQFEVDILTRSGGTIPFEFHSRMINYQHKPAVLSMARDLSIRKQMEKTLIRGERLSAVGEMASGVAHNFNNLLQVIMGAGEAAIRKLESGEIRKCHDALGNILDASHRGADIVNRIKDFTLLTTGETDTVRVFSIGELIEEAVNLTRPLWKNPLETRKYRLNYFRTPGCLVEGNPSEIYEVAVNLIKNALEAMPRGGTLSISSEIREGRIFTSFTDTGKGVVDENIQRVFEPFFTTKGPQSSGLGLSSSYGLVKKHGGDIRVASAFGKGTTFTIVLPLAVSKKRTRDQRLSAQEFKTDNCLRFLMIDDEPNILKMMELWFEDSEVELYTASTAEKGLQTIRQERFDVILCDFGMDDMNGLEVGKAHLDFCRIAGIPKTPFMLLTGLDTQLDAETLRVVGVDRVVKKPIPADKLFHIIQEMAAASVNAI